MPISPKLTTLQPASWTARTASAPCAIQASSSSVVNAKFDIRMPDTWTITFDLSDAQEVEKKLLKSDEEIANLKNQLSQELKGKYLKFTLPGFIGKLGKFIYDGNVRKTKNLSVSDECIGCCHGLNFICNFDTLKM